MIVGKCVVAVGQHDAVAGHGSGEGARESGAVGHVRSCSDTKAKGLREVRYRRPAAESTRRCRRGPASERLLPPEEEEEDDDRPPPSSPLSRGPLASNAAHSPVLPAAEHATEAVSHADPARNARDARGQLASPSHEPGSTRAHENTLAPAIHASIGRAEVLCEETKMNQPEFIGSPWTPRRSATSVDVAPVVRLPLGPALDRDAAARCGTTWHSPRVRSRPFLEGNR